MLSMSEVAHLMNGFEYQELINYTSIPGVVRFRIDRETPCRTTVYDPGIYILAQGKKVVYAGGREITYNVDNYLVTSVSMPIACKTYATPEKPALGIYIKIDIQQLHDLIVQIGHKGKMATGSVSGLNAARMDPAMADAVLRLTRCLTHEQDARAIGTGLAREVLYRVLCGEQAHMLYALANHSGNYSRIAHALTLLQSNYAEKLDVEQLATSAHMSISAFHRAFKEMTDESPIQYLKKIRLTKARDLILQNGMKAYIAADEVGYESASQFSREFKRYFGQSPAELMRELRAA